MFKLDIHRKAAAALALVIALLACGPLSLLDGETAGITCNRASPAAGLALPGDRVPISGLPDDRDGFYVEVSAPDTDLFYTVLVEEDDGSVGMLVPVHPDGIAGGPLTFTIRSDEVTCPDFDLTVEALPAAPGAFKEQADSVGKQLAQWRDRADVSRDQLLNDKLDQELIPLALAQYLYDAPDNPNALVKYTDGTIELSEKDQALLDAMTDRSHMRQVIEEAIAAQAAVASTTISPPVGPLARPYPQSAANLAEDMSRQAACLQTLSGATGDLIQDADFGVMGIAVVNPAVGAAVGGAFLAYKLQLEYCAYMLPSRFTRMDVEVSIDQFNEDYDFQSKGGGELTEVTVSGESEGWHITGLLIDVALAATGPVGKGVNKLRGVEEVAGRNLMGEAIDTVAGATNNICGRSDCSDPLDIYVDPIPFFFVDVMDPDYVMLTAVNSIVLAPPGVWGSYEPSQVGQGGLRVDTHSGVFGDANISELAMITVDEIEVSVSPSDVKIEAGQSASFTGSIQHSDNPAQNQWIVEGEGISGVQAHNTFDFTFKAPEWELEDACKAETRVYGVYFKSTSMTGLRAGSNEDRIDAATVEVEQKPDPNNPDCTTPTPTPDQCPENYVVGTWKMDMGSYTNFMHSFNTADAEINSVTGDMTITFAEDGTATTSSDILVIVTAADQSMSFGVNESGTMGYTVDPTTNTLTTEGGQLITTSIDPDQTVQGEGSSVVFTCDGDTMSVIVDPAYPPLVLHRQ